MCTCSLPGAHHSSVNRLSAAIEFLSSLYSVTVKFRTISFAVKRNAPKPLHCLMLDGMHRSSSPVNFLL